MLRIQWRRLVTSFIIHSASLATAPERGVRYKYVSLPRKPLVKHNGTVMFHSFCSVLTVCLGNENEGKKNEEEKARSERIK